MLKEILETAAPWALEDSRELYGIDHWGSRYFGVSPEGDVTVRLRKGDSWSDVSIHSLAQGAQERGLCMPVLFRFRDILDSRIILLNESFAKAIREYGYKGEYRGVFPVKVNQQQEVISEIVRAGRKYHHGLEAGSKAELIAALGYMHDPESYIVCNGYKDEEFIDLALYGNKLGLKVIIVVERPGELELVLSRAEKARVKPSLGLRIKLTAKSEGHWTESGGDKSIFGLTALQITESVDLLRERNMLDCLELLHYHQGSQLPNIRNIRIALTEACRYYAELKREGARMGILDIGGGLAVDYDGSKTNFASSKNYSMEEFCYDVVEIVMSTLDAEGVEHPVIVSESGRSLVAYSSVLVFNVLDINKAAHDEIPEELPESCHSYLKNLRETARSITAKNAQEAFNDAIYYRDELHSLFIHGTISLREKSLADRIFWHVINKIVRTTRQMDYIPEDLTGIDRVIHDTYYGNFSIFQSLPDSWAIDQLFPIMPIHRLREEPRRPAVLADITCDSDGKIDRFIDLQGVKNSLLLHDLKSDEEYFLGIFLVGAYQETLGDLHNLFGDTNIVSISLDDEGTVVYEHETKGDSVADVLSYVEYDPNELIRGFRSLAERAVRCRLLAPKERREIVEAYEAGLRGYTYYEW
nr:biosynthetic arginine decarboxylase [Marispirochaeta aestuarii]